MLPDIRSVWSADPDLPILALHLTKRFSFAPLSQYRSVAIVAHSMGGLVVQRALLDDPDLIPRISHVILLGTPSGGLINAGFFSFLKPQLRNMAADGEFVKQLRREWMERFDGSPPFELLTVAGDRDQFVPPLSSLEPFPVRFRRVVSGDHVSMIRPGDANAESLRLLVATLSGRDEMPVAARRTRAYAAGMTEPDVEQALAGREGSLTHAEVVNAAIRLDIEGRRPEAIKLLEQYQYLGASLQGTLGGRYKRLWLESGDHAYAEQALELYRDGLRTAEADRQREPDEYHEQVYYHAINLAFMAFVAFNRQDEAVANARLALEHCAKAPRNVWRIATEAEAKLYLDQTAEALAAYREVVRMHGEPWQLQSVGQQAYYVARKFGNEALQEDLRTLFNPELRQTTGSGKTWLACALGHRACRENLAVLYVRLPRLAEDLALARADGRYPKLMAALGRVKLLILDDWGLAPLNPDARRDLLEIIDDRHGRTATLITSQFPIDRWHALIGEPTLADAILDRLVHNAHRIELKGESMRKRRPDTAIA